MKMRLLLVSLFAVAAHAADDSTATVPKPASSTDLQAVFVDPAAPEAAEIRRLGELAINRIAVSMVSEVNTTVAKDGAERALDVCHLKKLPRTGEIVAGLPRITAVKRTSTQVRDPANAPDAAEKLALARVHSLLEAGTPPRILIQRIDLSGGGVEWRIYRPVAVTGQCVACHGDLAAQSDELRAVLKQRYPADQAAGYSVGEWRGLIRVTVAEAPPPAKPQAQKTPAKKI